MKRPASYNTKQRDAILAYIASLGDSHATAAQIVEHFGKSDISVSRTTVYRHLNRLEEDGKIRRYTTGVSGACFQYEEKDNKCREHFHLKCENCGELLHLQCDVLEEIKKHISDEHDFQLDNIKTVFYGKCHKCSL